MVSDQWQHYDQTWKSFTFDAYRTKNRDTHKNCDITILTQAKHIAFLNKKNRDVFILVDTNKKARTYIAIQ